LGNEIALRQPHAAPSHTSTEELTPFERSEYESLERDIAKDIQAVHNVGKNLAIIRDKNLYREEYATFKKYLADKWNLSPPTVWHKIEHAATIKAIETFGAPNVVKPSGYQSTPLARLYVPEQRAEAWAEAVNVAGDKPVTREIVQEVVNRAFPPVKRSSQRPAVPSKPPADDPDADLTAALARGIIPVGADVETDDPTRGEPELELEQEPEPIIQNATDENWLATLPLTRELKGDLLARFHATALAFRHTRNDLIEYREKFLEKTKPLRRGLNGVPIAFDWMHKRIFTLNPPDRWESCGFCEGMGSCAVGGCPECYGNGFICN
jgi:hypothetical protein